MSVVKVKRRVVIFDTAEAPTITVKDYSEQLEHAMKMQAKAMQRVRRAATLLRKWQRRVNYYSKKGSAK